MKMLKSQYYFRQIEAVELKVAHKFFLAIQALIER